MPKKMKVTTPSGYECAGNKGCKQATRTGARWMMDGWPRGVWLIVPRPGRSNSVCHHADANGLDYVTRLPTLVARAPPGA